MGNAVSEEDEKEFLEASYSMSLDSPDIDQKINAGTTMANCQPKHTVEAQKKEAEALSSPARNGGGGEGLEVVMANNEKPELMHGDSKPLSPKHKRDGAGDDSKGAGKPARKKQERKSPAETERERQKKLSYFQMARLGYQELVNAIIRPPRADYKEETLGPPAFTFCGRRFTRTDFALRTKRGLNLQCSHWEPVERTSDRIPVVVYMHGNSSARVEVIPQLSYLLSLGLAVFSFDFAGSGKSDGEYVSLGYYEREDLMCVIAHLRATNVVSTIALWGRSMGAATALMHGDRDPSIACMILDSPFADLTQLAEEMVEKGREQGINVPNFAVNVALRMIQSSVRKQANFNIKHISPIAHADKCFIPALFVAGEHDDFINKRHSEAIHAKYAGDKNLIIVEGDHNSPRPKFMFDSVSIFLQTCLQIPNSWALRVHPGMNLMAPPWYFPGIGMHPPGGSVKSPSRNINRRNCTTVAAGSQPSSAGNGQKSSSASAASPAAVQENEEMGMTVERQREIQASLFKMLGQADDGAQADSGAGNSTGGVAPSNTASSGSSMEVDGNLAAAPGRNSTEDMDHTLTGRNEGGGVKS